MKRLNNLYVKICDPVNLRMASKRAARGKRKQYGVQAFKKNSEVKLQSLHESLVNKTYRTSEYKNFFVYEPKKRLVYSLPFCPDRVGQHAAMNELEYHFMAAFTADSYSCIKFKGIHGAVRAVKKSLRDVAGTQYCLKLDLQKFYESIDHSILKQLLRRKFKDQDLLDFLDEVIDSAPGVPIGNYLSQFFANFYLTGFDHWLKEVKRVKHYFRYSDDIVILADNKPYLHQLLADIRQYLSEYLNLTIKGNYQVFPVAARGIDFVGYVFFHTHTRMRPSIKRRFARAMSKRCVDPQMWSAYWSWAKHADTKHLIHKLTACQKQQAA